MRPFVALALVLLVAVAGCTSVPSDNAVTSTPQPPRPLFAGVNATNCKGDEASLLMPADYVQTQLPATFTTTEAAPGFVFVVVESWRCENTAAMGIDRPDSTWLFVSTFATSANFDVPDGYASRVVFHASVSDKPTQEALEASGFLYTPLALEISSQPLPTAYDVSGITVRNEETTMFEWQHWDSKGTTNKAFAYRNFLSTDPTVSWDSESRIKTRISYGAVVLRASDGAPGSALLAGKVAGSGIAASLEEMTLSILPAGTNVA